MGNETEIGEERGTRARIPALEAEVARLTEQRDAARFREAGLRAELYMLRRVVGSLLSGLSAPEQEVP